MVGNGHGSCVGHAVVSEDPAECSIAAYSARARSVAFTAYECDDQSRDYSKRGYRIRECLRCY